LLFHSNGIKTEIIILKSLYRILFQSILGGECKFPLNPYSQKILFMKTLYPHVLSFLILLSFVNANAQDLTNSNQSSTSVTPAYSSKLLRDTYAGFCFLVRRASDNAEAWVEFDETTKSVTANSKVIIVTPGSSSFFPGTIMSFSKFYKSTSCYVTTWYDQSGNGPDAVQPDKLLQTRIVNAGVIDDVALSSGEKQSPETKQQARGNTTAIASRD
jgi:hypothetical protein